MELTKKDIESLDWQSKRFYYASLDIYNRDNKTGTYKKIEKLARKATEIYINARDWE